MQPKRWLFMALFLAAALLSTLHSAALSRSWRYTASEPPEIVLPGGMNGRTLLCSGEALDVRVADVSSPDRVEWVLDGRVVGKRPALYLPHLRNGEHVLSLTYRDSQDQLFATSALVRVLEDGDYALQLTAIQAAISLPLWEEDYQVSLPFVRR